MSIEFNEIEKLVDLFKPTTDNSDSEDEGAKSVQPGTGFSNPSQFGKPTSSDKDKEKKVNPYSKITEPEKRREILDPEEDADFLFDEKEHTKRDWKKTPSWDVKYKQQVSAEDVFLQMGFKNPTSASCEDMIITIHLPEEKHQNMDLKILKDKLTLVSPRFYLDLPLPHPVDPQRGNAQWDKDQEKLSITLRMDRELDLVNF